MAKGDYIEIMANVGSGTQGWRVTAEKQGRNVESEWTKDGNLQWYVVQERTRGGTVVQENRCAASAIIAITVVRKEV